MPTFIPNPNAEVSSDFDIVEAGVYRMRVVSAKDFVSKSGNTCAKIELEYVDPTGCITISGKPAVNPGHIFDNGVVLAPAEKQGKLRNLVEACGKVWGTVSEVEDLVGSELSVRVKISEWEGKQRNEVARYMPA